MSNSCIHNLLQVINSYAVQVAHMFTKC
uniref:Uncharacterized protein n=1 Tax=Rhizophora mucronata TaxID=61149 RepID=A0A2P2QNK4_RHIMU